jgi:xylulokinase
MILAAYDLGTTGCKASFFDESGSLVATEYKEYPTYYPREGWVEQNPEDWKDAVILTTRQLLQRSTVKAKDIACLCFSGHMMGCVPVDSDGRPLEKRTMLWADSRSTVQAKRLVDRFGWERFYRETGSGLDVLLYPAAKIPWIKENRPALYKRAAKFIGTKDVVCAWLTGTVATDYSDASDIGLLHLTERRWHSELIETLGIDVAKMPEVLPSTSVIGKLSSEVAEQIGFLAGTPVILGGGDVSCGTAGAGAVGKDTPYFCIGSAGWVSVVSDRPLINIQARPMSLCHVVPQLYCSQIIMYSAGVAYKWIRDQLFSSAVAGEQMHSDTDAFKKMDGLAETVPAGAGGVLFLPYLRAGGAPHYDVNARGAFLGLNLAATKAHLIRAALEGVAFNIRIMVGYLEENAPFPELRIIGGGAESRLWKQIFADVLQKNICTLTTQQESNTLGAALVGGIGIGILTDFSDINRFNEVKEVTVPNPEDSKTYQQVFPVFAQAYRGIESTNRSLGRISEKRIT